MIMYNSLLNRITVTNGELKMRMRARGVKRGSELRRSPDYLMPELFLECTAYVM